MRRKKVTFEVFAPRARNVYLMGDFNQWDPGTHPLRRERRGKWRKSLLLAPGRYRYAFLVDGRQRDPFRNASAVPKRFEVEKGTLHVYTRSTKEI
ncbi:MAG: hypothetical protein PVH82_05950 [Desulfobacteraceae bacterium]|jgi:1,4-alpha-glucan branching enzyme